MLRRVVLSGNFQVFNHAGKLRPGHETLKWGTLCLALKKRGHFSRPRENRYYTSFLTSPHPFGGLTLAQREDIIAKMNAGLISPVTAVMMMYDDMDPKEAREYLLQIRRERAEFL